MKKPGEPLVVVIKLGSSSILSPDTLLPNLSTLSAIAETCVTLIKQGHRVVLVSSGAIAMGMRRMNKREKGKALPEKQALAAIGQGRLIALWDNLFSQLDQPIAQVLLTRNDISDHSRFMNARSTLLTLLNQGVIPIVNENDTISVSEIKFGDNDTLSAITGALVSADWLFLCTDVECLWTENPRRAPAGTAKQVLQVSDIEEVRKLVSTSTLGSSLGTGGMETKIIAAELATAAGVGTVITLASQPSKILSIIEFYNSYPEATSPLPVQLGPPKDPITPLHTYFHALSNPLPHRRFWVLHALAPRGSVYIDEGAYRAVLSHGAGGNGGRLLASGVQGTEGVWAAGQAVRIMVIRGLKGKGVMTPKTRSSSPTRGPYHSEEVTTEKTWSKEDAFEVGRGLANYNSVEIERVKGLKSSELEKILGYIEAEHVVESITVPDKSGMTTPKVKRQSLSTTPHYLSDLSLSST